jgi:hypothetical protein
MGYRLSLAIWHVASARRLIGFVPPAPPVVNRASRSAKCHRHRPHLAARCFCESTRSISDLDATVPASPRRTPARDDVRFRGKIESQLRHRITPNPSVATYDRRLSCVSPWRIAAGSRCRGQRASISRTRRPAQEVRTSTRSAESLRSERSARWRYFFNFRFWRFSELSDHADDVRSWGQSRPRNWAVRLPKMTLAV